MQLPVQLALPPFSQVMLQAWVAPVQSSAQVELASQRSWQPPPEQVCLQSELKSQSKLQPPPGQSKSHLAPLPQSSVQLPPVQLALQFPPRHSPCLQPEVPHWN